MFSQSMSISAKELSYISDSLKNEQLLTMLCVQSAVKCQNPQLKTTAAQLANERFINFSQLMNTLQNQSQNLNQNQNSH